MPVTNGKKNVSIYYFAEHFWFYFVYFFNRKNRRGQLVLASDKYFTQDRSMDDLLPIGTNGSLFCLTE